MASPHCFSDTLASMAAPLLADLLCFCSLAASHPLLLAYLLFFSSYLMAALSFLAPLLLSTCFLLLALRTVSPYLKGTASRSPPPTPDGGRSPPPPFCNTLRLVLDMLEPSPDGEAGVPPPGALCDIASELQACVDTVEEMYRERGVVAAGANQGCPGPDGGEGRGEEEEEEEAEEKRIVAEAAPRSELFGWELEAISKLYKALTYEVEEFPIKLALRSFKEGELFPPGIGFHGGDRKLQPSEPGEDLPRTGASWPEFESRDRKVPTCEDGEDVDIPLLGNASKSAIKIRDRSDLPAPRDLTVDDISCPSKRATLKTKSEGISRSESDGSRSGKLLRRSTSSSSSTSRAAGSGLSRVASAGGWRGIRGTNGAPPQALSSSGSMRKEKEWRRTLECKLLEERMVTDGGEEGMDLLWETYELGSGKDGDISRSRSRHGDGKGDRKESSKAKAAKRGAEHVRGGEEEEGEEEEEEEETVGRLCCLQALRFSSAKMGFGFGRSGLLKVSKAMKGVGAFRRALRAGSRKAAV